MTVTKFKYRIFKRQIGKIVEVPIYKVMSIKTNTTFIMCIAHTEQILPIRIGTFATFFASIILYNFELHQVRNIILL